MKNRQFLFVLLLLIIAVSGYLFVRNQPIKYNVNKMCVTHDSGMHIHALLSIYINKKPVSIPGNIGITPAPFCMRPVHTHDDSGTVHLQFPSQTDVRLADFFKMWGKRFDSQCILDKCNGSEGKVRMFVNGRENRFFERYIMHDQDQIEIRFE